MIVFNRLDIHAVDHCNLACLGCNHHSPFMRKKDFSAADYVPWLRKLRDHGVVIDRLGITGGECFLNKGLADLVAGCKEASGCKEVDVFSNVFWLRDEASIEKYRPVLEQVEVLVATKYKPIVEKVGGLDELLRLLDLVRERCGCRIQSFQEGVVTEFGQSFFYDEPRPRQVYQCEIRDCTQLRSDGTLFRCPQGYAIGSNPAVTEGFAKSVDIRYDLTTDLEMGRDLAAWYAKWPLDACEFCGVGCMRDVWTPWVSDPAIRNMDKEAYVGRLVQLVVTGK